MFWLFVLFALVMGAGLPLQALINARLGAVTAGPIFAALMSFIVGIAALIVLLLVQRPAWPAASELLRLPGWIWIGGLLGAGYVVAAILGIPIIGAAGFVAVAVLGQMVGALLLDHYGILHPAQPANAVRVIGVLLVMAGMLLVLQPWRR